MKAILSIALVLALVLCMGLTSGIALSDDTTTLTMFISHTWYWSDQWEGIIPETITEKTGVKLDITRAVDDQQLGIMIASADLPDLIYTDKERDRLSNPNLCYSYNELIEQYGLSWQPDPMLVTNAKSFSSDDNYYTLLQNFATQKEVSESSSVPMVCSLAYRADILEALGNPPMTTLDEYVAVLAMVKEKYPNMIPCTFSPVWGPEPFRVWCGMSSGDYMEYDGKVIYKISHPKFKEYLQFCNNLYRNGYILADNFAVEDNDSKAYVQNGQTFSGCYYTQGELFRYGEMSKAVDPNARIMESAPLSQDGWYSRDGIGWSGVYITKNNKNPEATIKFMEFMFSDEGQRLSLWGREGTEYTLGEDGLPKFSDEWNKAATDEKVFYTKYNPAYALGASAVVEAEGRCAVLPDDYRAVYPAITALCKVEPWISYGKPQGEMDEKIIMDKLEDLLKGAEPKVILSETDEEFENNYNTMMNNAKSIGIDKLEAYLTEHVLAAKALYE